MSQTKETFIKYNQALPDQFNDFNFWKPAVPFMLDEGQEDQEMDFLTASQKAGSWVLYHFITLIIHIITLINE